MALQQTKITQIRKEKRTIHKEDFAKELNVSVATINEYILGDKEMPNDMNIIPKKNGMVLKRNHIYGSGPPNIITHQETLDYIVRDSISPILDIGCGAGVYVSEMNIRNKNCQGVEINSEYVDIALKSNLPVSTYDGKTIPFDDGSFNTVMAIEVLEHVDQWENLLMEMLRVAARRVIVTTPNIAILSKMQKHNVVPWHLLEATHLNFFTKEIWRHIILKIENITGSVFEYSPLLLNGEIFNYHLYVLIEKF